MTAVPPSRMTSQRPYLLRAIYAWIADNGMTPHLLVDATRPGVSVPRHAVSDGKIVLNVADRAVAGLDMGNECISFTARFQGVSHRVQVPVDAVLLIYARETGQGMGLQEAPPDDEADAHEPAAREDDARPERAQGDDDDTPPPKRGHHLRVVK